MVQLWLCRNESKSLNLAGSKSLSIKKKKKKTTEKLSSCNYVHQCNSQIVPCHCPGTDLRQLYFQFCSSFRQNGQHIHCFAPMPSFSHFQKHWPLNSYWKVWEFSHVAVALTTGQCKSKQLFKVSLLKCPSLSSSKNVKQSFVFICSFQKKKIKDVLKIIVLQKETEPAMHNISTSGKGRQVTGKNSFHLLLLWTLLQLSFLSGLSSWHFFMI